MKYLKIFEFFRKTKIVSKSKKLASISFPEYVGDMAQMIPFDISNVNLPDNLKRWEGVIKEMIKYSPVKEGTAFITIDERVIETGKSQRKGGAHIDGNYYINEEWDTGGGSGWDSSTGSSGHSWKTGSSHIWKTDGEAGWSTLSKAASSILSRRKARKSKKKNESNQLDFGGMLIASTEEYCKVWEGEFFGEPGYKGDCEHLREQLKNSKSFVMEKNNIYWINSSCIHESLPVDRDVKRQLIRITLPHNTPHLK